MARNKTDRTIQIHFRVDQKEYESIKNKAAESGLSVSEFSRRILMGEKVIAAPPADYVDLIREVKRVGSNLDQVLRKLNVFGIAHDLELQRCASEIRETVSMLYRTFRPGKGVG